MPTTAARLYLCGLATGAFATVINFAAFAFGVYDRLARAVGASLDQSVTPVVFLQVFVGGPLAIWLYMALRPRFGNGVRTTAVAATYLWILLLPYGLTVLRLSGLLVRVPAPVLVVMSVAGWPFIFSALAFGVFLYRKAEPAEVHVVAKA